MLRASQILVRTLALAASAAAFAGCGQRGPLYLPTDPAASQRATLPQTLDPMRDTPVPTPIVPATPASSPSRPASSPTP